MQPPTDRQQIRFYHHRPKPYPGEFGAAKINANDSAQDREFKCFLLQGKQKTGPEGPVFRCFNLLRKT